MDPFQTVAAVGSGVIVGFTLGLVGGGGSILAVPLLLYVVGMPDPHLAIGTSAARGRGQCVRQSRAARARAACPLAAGADLRRRRIGWAPSSARRSARSVDGRRLLILFALLMLFVAALMLRGRKADSGPVGAERQDQSLAARCDRARGWLAFRVLRDRRRVPRGARTDPRDRHADDRRDRVRAGRGRRFRHHDGGRTMPSPDSLIGRSRCCSSPAGSAADGSARVSRNGSRRNGRR